MQQYDLLNNVIYTRIIHFLGIATWAHPALHKFWNRAQALLLLKLAIISDSVGTTGANKVDNHHVK